jgi:hypothetical protein
MTGIEQSLYPIKRNVSLTPIGARAPISSSTARALTSNAADAPLKETSGYGARIITAALRMLEGKQPASFYTKVSFCFPPFLPFAIVLFLFALVLFRKLVVPGMYRVGSLCIGIDLAA